MHFVEKRPLFVDPEEETEAHEPSNKRQRLTVIPASAAKEALEEQRITNFTEDVTPIGPSARASTTLIAEAPPMPESPEAPAAEASSAPKPNFPWPAIKPAPLPIPAATPGPSSTQVARPHTATPATRTTQSINRESSRANSSVSVIDQVRADPQLNAIHKVFRDHPDITIPDMRDLSPNPLSRAFAAFALLANHANKPDTFEPRTYEEAISNNLNRMH